MRRLDRTTLITTLITATLAGIGAAAGFTHTRDWAIAHGQHGWLAWADAIVIEGMAIVAGFEVHRDHHAGRTGRAALFPQLVLVVSFVIQMIAQVAQAPPNPAGWLLAAMPALGFLTVVKLIMRRIPTKSSQTSDQSGQTVTQATAIRTEQPAPTPAPRPAITVATRLPASVRNTISALASQAHQQGRVITIDEIRRTITLPEAMLTQLVTELNTNLQRTN